MIVTLGLGAGKDYEEHMMEVDTFEEEVVKEILHFREDEVNLPTAMDGLVWEYNHNNQSQANLTVILGRSQY